MTTLVAVCTEGAAAVVSLYSGISPSYTDCLQSGIPLCTFCALDTPVRTAQDQLVATLLTETFHHSVVKLLQSWSRAEEVVRRDWNLPFEISETVENIQTIASRSNATGCDLQHICIESLQCFPPSVPDIGSILRTKSNRF